MSASTATKTMDDIDVIWRNFYSQMSKTRKKAYLRQLIANSKEKAADYKWLSKEARSHAREAIKIAQQELDTINNKTKKP